MYTYKERQVSGPTKHTSAESAVVLGEGLLPMSGAYSHTTWERESLIGPRALSAGRPGFGGASDVTLPLRHGAFGNED